MDEIQFLQHPTNLIRVAIGLFTHSHIENTAIPPTQDVVVFNRDSDNEGVNARRKLKMFVIPSIEPRNLNPSKVRASL